MSTFKTSQVDLDPTTRMYLKRALDHHREIRDVLSASAAAIRRGRKGEATGHLKRVQSLLAAMGRSTAAALASIKTEETE